ncbi:unnamed protein product, partial [Rotaria sp. Silwood2]
MSSFTMDNDSTLDSRLKSIWQTYALVSAK